MRRAGLFTQSVVSVWNALLEVVLEANMIMASKRFMNKHVDIQGMEEHGLAVGM